MTWRAPVGFHPAFGTLPIDTLNRTVRALVGHVEVLASDAEQWHALITDEQRIQIHRNVYGNRPTRRRWWGADRRPAATLFGEAS